jgi:hypothetical protein
MGYIALRILARSLDQARNGLMEAMRATDSMSSLSLRRPVFRKIDFRYPTSGMDTDLQRRRRLAQVATTDQVVNNPAFRRD